MQISVSCRLALYADDSALIFSHTDIDVIRDTLSSELGNCYQWLLDNKLSLHIGKTECIVFSSNRRARTVGGFDVTCGETVVKRVDTVKYLGVQLSRNMDGKEQAESVIKCCASRLSFLYRKAAFLDLEARKILTSALIQPHLDYCVSSWYEGVPKALKAKLDVIQRRMVRFIYSRHAMDHVGTRDLKLLSWLTIPDRVRYFKMVHVFRIRAGLAPNYLSEHFRPVSAVHSYGTRSQSYDFHISKEISMARTSFAYSAISNWNALPESLKGIQSLSHFKSKLKSYLLSCY